MSGKADLAKLWWLYKAAEDAARQQRLEIELAILAQHPEIQIDEPGTIHIGGLVVTKRESTSVDQDALNVIVDNHPELMKQIAQVVSTKTNINKAAWNNATSDVRKVMAKAVTIKMSKPSFSIEGEK